MDISYMESILEEGNTVVIQSKELLEHKRRIEGVVSELDKELKIDLNDLDVLIRAGELLGAVSEENTEKVLGKISTVLNKALTVLFPNDTLTVRMKKEMYRSIYPHYKVELTVNGKIRSFKQNGSGLAQIISFLFVVALVDARGGRKLIVMDELLNGLHPDAKYILRDLLTSLSGRFQFVIVEYGMDIGQQYEIKRHKGIEASSVTKLEESEYYKNVNTKDREVEDLV